MWAAAPTFLPCWPALWESAVTSWPQLSKALSQQGGQLEGRPADVATRSQPHQHALHLPGSPATSCAISPPEKKGTTMGARWSYHYHCSHLQIKLMRCYSAKSKNLSTLWCNVWYRKTISIWKHFKSTLWCITHSGQSLCSMLQTSRDFADNVPLWKCYFRKFAPQSWVCDPAFSLISIIKSHCLNLSLL